MLLYVCNYTCHFTCISKRYFARLCKMENVTSYKTGWGTLSGSFETFSNVFAKCKNNFFNASNTMKIKYIHMQLYNKFIFSGQLAVIAKIKAYSNSKKILNSFWVWSKASQRMKKKESGHKCIIALHQAKSSIIRPRRWVKMQFSQLNIQFRTVQNWHWRKNYKNITDGSILLKENRFCKTTRFLVATSFEIVNEDD